MTKAYTVREVFESDVPTARDTERGQLYRDLRLRLEKTHRPQALAVTVDIGGNRGTANVAAYLRRAFERDMPGKVLIVARQNERTIYLRWK